MRSINPSAKLIGLLVLTLVTAFVHHPVWNLILFGASVALILTSAANKKAFWIPMIPILLLAFAMFFTGYRFTRTDVTVVNTGRMMLTSGPVWNGLIFASRVVVYAGIGLLYALTTDKVRMVRSFQKQLHMPQIFAYGLLAAWGLFPQMATEYRRTKLAFAARGIRVFPFSPALLSTLMVKATRWSESLSLAMESKGFSGRGKRTEYQPERMRRRDLLFLVITCGVLPVIGVLVFR